jgi:hypothetical protein
MMTDEQWIDFFIQIVATLVGAFVGAGLAFLLNWLHYKNQKREENIGTLRFLIACLCYLLNNALNLKEQIVQDRYKEAVNCKAALDNLKEHTVPLRHEEAVDCKKFREPPPELRLQIEHMSQYIYCGDFEWPMAQEKLEFLASPNPNVIMLVGAAKMALSKLNTIICDINADVNKYMKGEEKPDVQKTNLMIKQNECLFFQLNEALSLTNRLVEVLFEFGLFRYAKSLKMRKIELTDEKYKALLPEPIDKSWEEYEWFPKKKKWWQSKTEGIKT